MSQNPTNQKPSMAVSVNLDTTPILYTDNVIMTTNEDGLVLDFCQKVGNRQDVRIVSRIGMSRNHGKKFAVELTRLLAMTEGHSNTGEKN